MEIVKVRIRKTITDKKIINIKIEIINKTKMRFI
jgi:hypothetical protein